MKKTTFYFCLLTFMALFFATKSSYAQCAASFSYSIGSGGVVTFTNTSIPSGTTGSSYWTFGNSTSSITPNTTSVVSTTYFANGNYVVTLFFATGTCSSSPVSQTINITTVTTPSCNLTASFTAYTSANGAMHFYDNSTGTITASTYTYNFGDGSPNSNSPNITHTYTMNGTYTVTLDVNNNYSGTPCISSYTGVVTVSNVCNLTANFSYSISPTGYVSFTATPTPTLYTVYGWNFGNGSSTNFVYNWNLDSTYYTANGNYVVTLTVTQGACVASVTQTLSITTITSTPCTLNANFYTTGGGTTATYNFNAGISTGTTGSTAYAWSYGDGGTGSGITSSHTYSAPGTYAVVLSASNTASCVSTKTIMVVISSCSLAAGISYSLGANGNVSFHSTTTGTTVMTYYTWAFGDGTNGYIASPAHNYTNGTYTVTLVATNASVTPACSDTAQVVITVTTNTCNPNITFSMVPSGTPHVWYAIPSASANIAGATWSWGDGTYSYGLFSSHTYSAAGNYSVCMTLTMTCGTVNTYCWTGYLSKSANSDNSIIQVNVVSADQLVTGLKNNSVADIAYNVYPNPASGQFQVSMNGLTAAKAKINVYNLIGKAVYETESEITNGSLVKDIDLNDAANGVYFIKVTANNKLYTQKLIISK